MEKEPFERKLITVCVSVCLVFFLFAFYRLSACLRTIVNNYHWFLRVNVFSYRFNYLYFYQYMQFMKFFFHDHSVHNLCRYKFNAYLIKLFFHSLYLFCWNFNFSLAIFFLLAHFISIVFFSFLIEKVLQCFIKLSFYQ